MSSKDERQTAAARAVVLPSSISCKSGCVACILQIPPPPLRGIIFLQKPRLDIYVSYRTPLPSLRVKAGPPDQQQNQ